MVDAADDWHGCGDRGGSGAGLVAEQVQIRYTGADKGEAVFGALAGEIAAFGEEAVAGVNGVAPVACAAAMTAAAFR